MVEELARIADEVKAAAPWADEQLRRVITDAIHASRRQWPALSLPSARLCDYLKARWHDAPAATQAALAARVNDPQLVACAGDLFLACASAEGQAEALRIFERDVLRAALPALRALKQGPDFVDEVLQRARERLLVGAAGGRPRIEEYGGQGRLERWVRVLTVRIGLQLLRDRDQPVPDEDAATPEPAGRDPERDHLQARYAAWFKQSIKRAFADVGAEDRRLLELVVKERLSMAEVGARLGVNKSTISRRITAIRVQVFDAIQRLAREELRVNDREYASLVRLLQSQLDISLGLIATPPE